MTPTHNSNYFALLADGDDSDDDDDDITIPASNTSRMTTCHTARNTMHAPLHPGLPLNTYNAISDTGATAHFLTTDAPAINIKAAVVPLTVTMPDGNKLTSTHTCNLDIPWLPANVTEAHIIPGLSHSSLIAASKFCDNGYTLTYNADSCTVTDKHDQVALIGQRDRATGL